MKACTQEEVIKVLNPLLQGFANYYRGQVSKETFSYISYRVWRYLWRWCCRRHPLKSKKWIANKYFGSYKGIRWTFLCKGTGRGGKEKFYVLYDISSTPIVRHVKVKGTASPDDPSLRDYWHKRSLKIGKHKWAKGSTQFKNPRQRLEVRLEPCDWRQSRTVLRGRKRGDSQPLPAENPKGAPPQEKE